ncbi:MAG TPA: hypothetical protein PL151_19800 [Phycisphaerae bacterium]|nr:hypothetical protein [Phycisphaerae bacterium]HOM53638.1 hypothetical protein [Phycisphaerae bacterium]HON68069.1 hypothetical protein [Phycisphaerae bacterium]HOQ86052.1 hypothetical protein [Phycisphaerae bacterium]HPP28997.1 hypothetical protein [Phycisphaerae bacterium]
MASRRSCRCGIVVTEVVIGVGVIALVAVLAAQAVFDYQRASASDDCGRAALWAAQAQLLRLHAGAPLDSKPPEGLICEDIRLTTNQVAGQGPWEGFDLVTVVAEVAGPDGRPVRAQVRGYVSGEGRP